MYYYYYYLRHTIKKKYILLLLFLMMCTLQVDDPFQVETDRVVIRVKATRPVVLDPQNACFTLQ